MAIKQAASAPAENTNERYEVIIELLEALQALPDDMSEVRTLLTQMGQDNDFCYAVLKEQGWLLKDQALRLKKLEAY